MISSPESKKWKAWPIWGEEELRYVQLCLEKGDWSRGQAILEFETAFAEFCNCKYALLVNSGTDALTIALKAAGVGPGDEVIVPGLTWHSTAFSVLECGAKAVIVDIEPHTYGISSDSVIEHLSEKTKAIIAVHLFNSTANLDKLLEITNKTGIALIEDAAQAHGCHWKRQQVGTFGAAGIFSFQQKKLITCGEGGCLVTNDEALFSQAYSLRDHGVTWENSTTSRYGGNNRISSISAAILLAQLNRLTQVIDLEECSGQYLTESLNQIQGLACLERRESITQQTFCSFCFRLLDMNYLANGQSIRQELTKKLQIPFSSTYPPLDEQSFFKPYLEQKYQGLWKFGNLTNCYKAYQEAVRFPHQYLLNSQDNLDKIIEGVKSVLQTPNRMFEK